MNFVLARLEVSLVELPDGAVIVLELAGDGLAEADGDLGGSLGGVTWSP